MASTHERYTEEIPIPDKKDEYNASIPLSLPIWSIYRISHLWIKEQPSILKWLRHSRTDQVSPEHTLYRHYRNAHSTIIDYFYRTSKKKTGIAATKRQTQNGMRKAIPPWVKTRNGNRQMLPLYIKLSRQSYRSTLFDYIEFGISRNHSKILIVINCAHLIRRWIQQ